MSDKRIDYHSLRATLETKSRDNLLDVAQTIYGYGGSDSVGKTRLIEFLAEAIQAEPENIAMCFPAIGQSLAEAIWNAFRWGSARFECPGPNYRKLLQQLFFVGVQRDRGDVVIHIPDEIREMYEDGEILGFWEEQRSFNDTIDDIAEACVRRYGHVTVNEILALCVKWYGMPKSLPMKASIKRVLGGRSSMCLGEAEYYLLGDAVLHLSICGRNPKDLVRLAPDFFEERKQYPRWMPKSEDDFLEIIAPDYYEKTAATHRLLSYLCDVLDMDTEEVDAYIVDLNEELMGGERLEVAFDLLAQHGGACSPNEKARFHELITDFAADVRLRWLNGHSSAEVGKAYEPLPPDRVFHSSDIDEEALRFPNYTLEESHSPEFDNLDVEEEEPRVGRNDLCPCGSGKKYKKCCGK